MRKVAGDLLLKQNFKVNEETLRCVLPYTFLKPTTVSIQPIDPWDHHAMLFAYISNVPEQSAIGIINLTTGIYLITSRNQLDISGDNIHTENFEKDLGNEQLHQISAAE